MNRITKYSGGVAVIPKEKIKDAAERLAKYEDTGLTPEEIMGGKMLTRKELNPYGKYLCKFAENHGMTIEQAKEQTMVKARLHYFQETGQ